MFCVKCGKELKDGTCFCPKCGTQVEMEAEKESVADKKEGVADEQIQAKIIRDNEVENISKQDNVTEDNIVEKMSQSIVQPVEVVSSSKSASHIKKKTWNWNSGLANCIVVAGVVLLLVGTAFIISRPKDGYADSLGDSKNNQIANVGGNTNIGSGESNNEDKTNNNIETTTIKNTENSINNSEIKSESEKDEAVLKRTEYYINGFLCDIAEYDENGYRIFQKHSFGNGKWMVDYYEYNTKGNEISRHNIDYDSNGQIEDELWVYNTYDKKGNEISQHDISYDSNGQIDFELWVYNTYDKKGNILSKTFEYSYGDKSMFTYTYDNSNREIERVRKDYYNNECRSWEKYTVSYKKLKNTLSSKYTYFEYDESTGNYYETGEYDYEKTVVDDNGNTLQFERICYDSQGEITRKRNEKYEYDSKGNLLEESYNDSLDCSEYCSYTYDELGNMLSKYFISYAHGFKQNEYNINYEYDLNLGKCIKSTTIVESGALGNYTWIVTLEYDNNGNLIRKKETENSSNSSSEYITYYTYYE